MNATLVNKQQTPTTIRALGAVLIVIGSLLTGGMIALMVWINYIIAGSGKPSSTTTWNGSAEEAQIVFLVLGTVAAFGVMAMITGLWQLLTGRRNKLLVGLMLAVCAGLIGLAWIVRIFF
jgi:hypothetical protein